ncbi:hypothetical protein CHUAL_009053 [Chamberlinius hualienensis]
MKSLQAFFLVMLYFGVSSAKDGEPLPPKSYQVSCSFQEGMCNWTNDPFAKQQFIITNKPNVPSPPNGCKYLILSRNPTLGTAEAILNSPEFTTLQTMNALQVNISYWFKNDNNTAQLKLTVTPLEGALNGSTTMLWSTGEGQTSSKLWNITTVYAKHLGSAQKLKLSLHAFIGGTSEFVAVSGINVTEIMMPDVGILPDVTYTLSNQSTCRSGANIPQLIITYTWFVVLAILYTLI